MTKLEQKIEQLAEDIRKLRERYAPPKRSTRAERLAKVHSCYSPTRPTRVSPEEMTTLLEIAFTPEELTDLLFNPYTTVDISKRMRLK